MRIPKIFHFCYFGGREFNILNFLAIKSAKKINNPEAINFYFDVEPTGQWWQRSKPLINPVKVEPFDTIFGQKVNLPQHKTDYWRLKTLIEQGGIYLDLDVICKRPFDDLLDEQFVLGKETGYGKLVGLNNSVILSEKNAAFAQRWLAGYDPARSLWKGFRSTGFDLYYTEMSVKYPLFLSQFYAVELKIIESEQFFRPDWTEGDLDKFFKTTCHDFDNNYVCHLWETRLDELKTYDQFLNEESIKNSDSVFASLARPLLEE